MELKLVTGSGIDSDSHQCVSAFRGLVWICISEKQARVGRRSVTESSVVLSQFEISVCWILERTENLQM